VHFSEKCTLTPVFRAVPAAMVVEYLKALEAIGVLQRVRTRPPGEN